MSLKHPAKFSAEILDEITGILEDYGPVNRIIDPFAGTGRVHQLKAPHTVGVEIEPEWAAMAPGTIVGNALQLPFPDASFDCLVTSPCLEQRERVLTADLRWVPVGDVEVGDELIAFDEHPLLLPDGTATRRKWQRATVVRSEPKTVPCVRVILTDGSEVVTTPEHPWLAARGPRRQPVWTASHQLMGTDRMNGPYYVMRQATPWSERRTYDAGWLAGMLDGEGSVSLGAHGCPKLCCYQAEGEVADRAEELMARFGYNPNRIVRKDTPDHRRKVVNLYVTGGFSALMQALGELRPRRLLAKWETLDLTTRSIQATPVQVLKVEPAGEREIQEIETSTGTYIGEGFLMHNCYGNRYADKHNAQDGSRRRSYTHDLRAGTGDLARNLHPDNSGAMHWGDEYRTFHWFAWMETLRVLAPDSLLVVNVSNHIRGGAEQYVTEWHLRWFMDHGCAVEDLRCVPTARYREGTNREARATHENILVLRYVAPVLTPEDPDEEEANAPYIPAA